MADRDNQLQMTLRRSCEEGGVNNLRASLIQSPNNGFNGQDYEWQEQLKAKEEEIKILWNVIKEINKGKGNGQSNAVVPISMDQLRQVIT